MPFNPCAGDEDGEAIAEAGSKSLLGKFDIKSLLAKKDKRAAAKGAAAMEIEEAAE